MGQIPTKARPSISRRVIVAASAAVAGVVGVRTSEAQRSLGVDISAWQGEMTVFEWETLKRPTNQQVNGISGDGRDFVFIRSSRGGTTGFYNQSNAGNNNPPGQNTLSQRYDDPYFIQNITRATAAGMMAGSYHFGRMDIIENTLNSNGIANTGTDEANHFLEMAGPWMRPGYLPPVFDLEAGISQRTGQQLAQFAIDFSNRIYEAKGIRPAVYTGGNYAADMQAEANAATRQALVAAYPMLWTARWPNQADPFSIPVHTANPKDFTSTVYGPWDDAPNPTHPWTFWQYASTARLNGNNEGASNTDVNVANGNIEFVKDQLVPAIWTKPTSGNWNDLSNWNSGETPTAPVQGPGQVARVGPMTLPGPRLPGRPDLAVVGVTGQNDTVNLNRPNENIVVTFDASAPVTTVRRLNLNEQLNVTGGSLNILATDAALTAGTLTAGSGGTLSLSGGTVTAEHGRFNAGSVLEFSGAGTLRTGTLVVSSEVRFTGSSGTGLITNKTGAAAPSLNLSSGTRIFTIGNGSASTDLNIAIPIAGGNLVKEGLGTLELSANNAAFDGGLVVANGHLLVTNALIASGVTATQTAAAGGNPAKGGTIRLATNGQTFSAPLTIGGSGSAVGSTTGGALENVSGNNSWSGVIRLDGDQHNLGAERLNQIASTSGTLTLSGVIENAPGRALASWAKTGAGDVVLTGNQPNTYNHITRVFGGRLIIEKDAALGPDGNSAVADGNTFMLPNTTATIAFRAPADSSGFTYSKVEWIHTEGTGVSGSGQIDNYGGDNVFAGHLGLGGPVVSSVQQAHLGVTAGSLELQGGLYARGTVAAPRNITKSGAGTLILSGDSGPAPTNAADRSLIDSTVNIDAGAVLLKGTSTNSANVPGVTTWNVNNGTRLSVAKTNASGTATIALNGGGTLHTSSVAEVGVAGPVSLAGSNTIDTDGAATIMTLSGAVAYSAGSSLSKTGAGTLNVAGTISNAGGFQASAGVTNFQTETKLANLTIANAAMVGVQAGLPKAVDLGGLGIAGSGKLDLANNAMVVRDGSVSAIGALIVQGYNGGGWDGAGISSSTAAADPNAVTAIGYTTNADANLNDFVGVTGLDANDVLVRFTFLGDSDLNGVTNLDDLPLFTAGLENPSGPQTWAYGDYDYNGVVNLDDFPLFTAGLAASGQSLSELASAIEMSAISSSDRIAMLNIIAAVPEPGALGVLAFAGTALLRRRRA